MSTLAIDWTAAVDFSAIIAENIRAMAARRGVNQTDIAKALGLNNGTVSLRWNNKRDWPLDDIARVAAYLRTTPWDLARPSSEYDDGDEPSLRLAPSLLPRLDSNQQPSDYMHGSISSPLRIVRDTPAVDPVPVIGELAPVVELGARLRA